MTYSLPQAPTAPAPASAPPTTEAPAPASTYGSGYDGNDGEEDCEDDSDASGEDDDSNLPYCDEVSGDYEPVPVTSQSEYQPQPTTPAPEPTTPAPEPNTPAPEPTTTTEPEPITLPTEPEPTTPPTEPEPTTTTEPEPTTTAQDNNNGGNEGGENTGGTATWYSQDGSEGACGGYHSDSEYIGAMNEGRYGDVSGRASFCIFAFF